MTRISTKKTILSALMIALVFLTTRFTTIPLAVGYFNIGDVAIMTAAILLGRYSGFLAGSIGSCLADIASGYWIYVPITFVVKGIEGFVAGVLASPGDNQRQSDMQRIVAVIAAAVIMVAGYFIAELYVLKLVDNTFGYATAIKNVLPNLIQGGISSVVAYLLSTVLVKVKGIRQVIN
jgi:uncharacterized membrane protein